MNRAKFLSLVVMSPGCWSWLGRKSPHGYGIANYYGRDRKAHRVMWGLVHRPLRPGRGVVRHVCDNTGCVNPSHLRLGTQAENNEDKAIKLRVRAKLYPGLVLRI